MRRWPLSTAALALVLAAHLTVAPAGEPPREAQAVAVRGVIVVANPEAGDGGYDLVAGRERYRSYPLVPTSDPQRQLLREVAGRERDVLVVGLTYVIARRPFLVIESVKELP